MQKLPKIGMFRGVDSGKYHDSPGISKSGLDMIARSPLHYWAAYLDPDREPREETPAMRLGTAIHAAVLEPERFTTAYMPAPKLDRRTKDGKEAWAALEAQAAAEGKEIIAENDHMTCLTIQQNVRSNKAAKLLLDDGEPELSVMWTDDETGVLCKCRPDWFNIKQNVIVDVKSTEDASPDAFQRSILRYDYHIQAAWYLDGIKAATGTTPKAFIFAAFEKSRPHAAAFYYADLDMLEIGRQQYRDRLRVYADCLSRNQWPGYPEQLQPVGLPMWFTRNIPANDNS